MSANLVKYLHLHKNFNWHHLLNSKENSFSCLSRAIAASSRTSSFPKATPRAQEPPPHSRSIPQAPPRAQEPPPHSRSIPQASPRAQEPPTHSRSIPQATPRAQEPPTHSRSIPQAPPRAQEPSTHSRRHFPSIASCARTATTLTKQTCSSASVRFAKPK